MKSQHLEVVGTATNCRVIPLETAPSLLEGSLTLDTGETIAIETRANMGALADAFHGLINNPGKVKVTGKYYHSRMGFPARMQLISLRRLEASNERS